MPKITYPDKVTGDQFFATEATEIKTVVNTLDDNKADKSEIYTDAKAIAAAKTNIGTGAANFMAGNTKLVSYVPLQFNVNPDLETTSREWQIYEGNISALSAISRDSITGLSIAVGTYFTFTYRKAAAGGAPSAETTVATVSALLTALSTSSDTTQVVMLRVNTTYTAGPCSLLLKVTP
jgi:hypothetical protein